MHAQIPSALRLHPGEAFGLPSGRASPVALSIEGAFESVLDVETGPIARFGKRNSRGSGTRAGAAEEEQRSARPVARLLESLDDLLNERAVRGGGEVLPFAKHRLTLQR